MPIFADNSQSIGRTPLVKINRIMGGGFLSKRLYYAPPNSDQIDEIRKYYGNIYPTVPSPKRGRKAKGARKK